MKKRLASLTLIGMLMVSGMAYADEYDIKTEDVQSAVFELQDNTRARAQLVDWLHGQVGKPYVWGATGTDYQSYDCSSLVQIAYRIMGIELPRVSYMQAREGIEISLEDIEPGDVVCFVTSSRNNGDVTHVGVYVGDGHFIHAKSSKYGVVKQLLSDYYHTLVSIRRIMN